MMFSDSGSRWTVATLAALLALALGCAGTRKKEAATPTAQGPGVEEVLGTERPAQQPQEQAESEDEVLKLLGITVQGQEAEKAPTTATKVEKSETDKLKERVQELERQLSERENQIASLKADLAAREKTISELQSRARTAPVPRPAPTGELRAPAQDFRVRYEDALAEYKARNFKRAIQLFQELIQTDPNNSLSDNCQYWIGECYYGLEDYQQALVAFEKVFSFPGTNKAPDAQLKIALCYLKLGDTARARQEFQRLIDNYPDSEYVSKARQYLAQL